MRKWLLPIAIALVLVVVGALVGTALGVGGVVVVNRLPNDWRSLGSPPSPAVAIVAGDDRDVYVSAADGAIYHCSLSGTGACWEAWLGDVQVKTADHDYCSPDFVPTPPGNGPVDLVYGECGAEYLSAAAYRLQADGSVEVWTRFSGSWLVLGELLLFPVVGCGVGGLIGLVMGAVILLRAARRKRSSAPASAAPA